MRRAWHRRSRLLGAAASALIAGAAGAFSSDESGDLFAEAEAPAWSVAEPIVEFDLGSGGLAATGGMALKSVGGALGGLSLVDVATWCGDAVPNQEFAEDEDYGTVLRFTAGEGVYIPNIARLLRTEERTEFTVRLVLRLDDTWDRARILNVNFGHDEGVYVRRQGLRLSRTEADNCELHLQHDVWYSFTIATGPSKNLALYVNGYSCGRHFPAERWERALQIVSDHMLFFNDEDYLTCDGNDGGEHSAGFLKSIQVWDTMLGDEAIALLERPALGQPPVPCAPPTPACRVDAALCYDFGRGSLEPVGRTYGAPAIVDVGDVCRGGADRQLFVEDEHEGTMLSIIGGQGLLVPNIRKHVPTGEETEFTIRLQLMLSEMDSHGRLLNMNFGNDTGLYAHDGGIELVADSDDEREEDFGGCDEDWVPHELHSLTVTARAGAPRTLHVYYDGHVCGSWEDPEAWDGGIRISGNDLLLFNDLSAGICDAEGHGENVGPTYVKSIEIFARQLSHEEVLSLEEDDAHAGDSALEHCVRRPPLDGVAAITAGVPVAAPAEVRLGVEEAVGEEGAFEPMALAAPWGHPEFLAVLLSLFAGAAAVGAAARSRPRLVLPRSAKRC